MCFAAQPPKSPESANGRYALQQRQSLSYVLTDWLLLEHTHARRLAERLGGSEACMVHGYCRRFCLSMAPLVLVSKGKNGKCEHHDHDARWKGGKRVAYDFTQGQRLDVQVTYRSICCAGKSR